MQGASAHPRRPRPGRGSHARAGAGHVDTGRTFCLVEGPDPEALEHVLRLAYGLTADEIFKITEG